MGRPGVRARTTAAAGNRDRHAMWTVRKNSADLTDERRTSLAAIQATNKMLYRAYVLKEQLRERLRIKGDDGRQLLAGWLSWAKHPRIPEFVAPIDRHRQPILDTLDHHLSNARSEATGTQLRALTKLSYDFLSHDVLIGMSMLADGGLCPALPA